MKGFLASFLIVVFCAVSARGATTSCGDGYILVERANIDGISAAECQKLWCRDLETGKSMGSGNKPNSGYKTTAYPNELCDANRNCISCFGDRTWCKGEVVGDWNPEYGAYTRGGDNASYESYQKGACFAWRLEKPNCEDGQTAVLKNGAWICGVSSTVGGAAAHINKASSVRRTGTVRRY